MWHHVDASDRVLGKLAERIAIVLMGKHKPIYDPGGTHFRLLDELTASDTFRSGLRRLCRCDERAEHQGHREEGPADRLQAPHHVPWRAEGDSVQGDDAEKA